MATATRGAGAVLAAGLLACGSGGGSAAGGHRVGEAGAAVSLEARVDADDAVVARVDGRPVYASCVAAQLGAETADRAPDAAAPDPDAARRAALAQCIDFELLAGAAAARGLAADPALHETQKREAVRRFVDRAFGAGVTRFAQLPAEITAKPFAKARELADLPELREVVYVRAPAEDAPSGSADDLWAKGVADELYAALRTHEDLDRDRFAAIANETAHGRAIEIGKPYSFRRHGQAVEAFAAAGFAIPHVGMVSPPTRTRWGWDVILLTRQRLPTVRSDAELQDGMFPELKRRYFNQWAHQFAKGVSIDVAEEWLPRLVASDREQGALLTPPSVTPPAVAPPAAPTPTPAAGTP